MPCDAAPSGSIERCSTNTTDGKIALHILLSEAYRCQLQRHETTPAERSDVRKKWAHIINAADDCYTGEGKDGVQKVLSTMLLWSDEGSKEFKFVDPSDPTSFYAQRRQKKEDVLAALYLDPDRVGEELRRREIETSA